MGLLHAVIFLVGAGVLVLETLGSLLLAPYFGTSATTWSALIATTLAALAVGAAFGGGLADRGKEREDLAALLRIAALWIAVVPQARGWLLPPLTGLGLKGGALAAAAVLLFAPLAALGASTPLIVRLSAGSTGQTGRAYGAVSAVSTVGGVVGALVAGFWLLPYFPIRAVLLGTAAMLFAAGTAVGVPGRKPGL